MEDKLTDLQKELDEVTATPKVVNLEAGKLQYNNDGALKKTRSNLITLLKGGDEHFKRAFAYNEAINDIEITKDISLGSGYTLSKGRLNDNAIVTLWGYLSDSWRVEYNNADIYNACHISAQLNKYNPVKEFLEESLKSSELKDPFTIILRYLNIKDDEYNRIVFDLFFRGAIARVFHPGIQFDYCLDLVGKQGTGKTTFLREVFKGFQGNFTSFKDKDDILKMMSLWAVTDDEMIASKAMSFGELKSFVTTTVHLIRRPYGRIVEHFLVDYVITRTTNEVGHLKDLTGDRRFLAVHVDPKTNKHEHQITDEDLRDLWGNYYRRYKENQTLYYEENSKEGKIIAKERLKYRVQDDVIERLEWYLNTPIPEDFYAPSVSSAAHHYFYFSLEEGGVSHKDHSTQAIEWKGTVKRDRLSLNGVINDIFQDEKDRSLKTKIKTYMNNLDGWEYSGSVRFGNRNTSGWFKK